MPKVSSGFVGSWGFDVRITPSFQDALGRFTDTPQIISDWFEYTYNEVLDDMMFYPPAYSKTYKRTYRLYNSWEDTSHYGPLHMYIGNSEPYADYVQGENQISQHASHGWIRIDQAINEKELVAELEDHIARALGAI